MAQKIISDNLRSKLKTVLLSSLGGGLEFYDFIIFAIFAKSIGENFFPASSSIANLIHSYGVFAIGYLIRPLGGLLFSHFGDKFGRKQSFSLSISLMAVSTLLMSLIPNYEQWGLAATFTFIFLRLLQGISIGAEIPGAITFVSEHVPKQKGAACGVILLCLNGGLLLGDLVHVLLSSFLDPSLFHYYAWRIAFFIGGFFALISFYMRQSLSETDGFLANKRKHRVPFLVLMKHHKISIVKAICLAGAAASVTSIFLLYFNSYSQSILNLSSAQAGALSLHQLLVFLTFSAFASYLSDRVGCTILLKLSAAYLMIGPFLVFKIIHGVDFAIMEWVLLINAGCIGIYSGAMPCYLSELFPTSVRYSGIALGYNLGFAVFGGLSPLVSSLLISAFQWPEAPALMIALSGLLAFFSFSLKTEKSALSLSGN